MREVDETAALAEARAAATAQGRRRAAERQVAAYVRRREAGELRELERELRAERALDCAEEIRAEMRRARKQALDARARRRAGRRPRSPHKDLDRLVAAAWAAGCRIRVAGSGHISVRTPAGALVSVPGTPSAQRTLRRVRAELRQGGVEIP